MEPAFYRGDLLILTNFAGVPYEVGNIVVYNIPGEDIPIVHRVIEIHDMCVSLPSRQGWKSRMLRVLALAARLAFLRYCDRLS
jgi:signal peptidase